MNKHLKKAWKAKEKEIEKDCRRIFEPFLDEDPKPRKAKVVKWNREYKLELKEC